CLLAAFPDLAPDDIRSTSMGAGGEDVQLSPAARKLIPFSVECKARARLKSLYDWLAQAKAHGKGKPLVVVKQNHSKPLAVLEFDTLVEVLANVRGSKDGRRPRRSEGASGNRRSGGRNRVQGSGRHNLDATVPIQE